MNCPKCGSTNTRIDGMFGRAEFREWQCIHCGANWPIDESLIEQRCPECGAAMRYERFNWSDFEDSDSWDDKVGVDWWCPACGWTVPDEGQEA